MRSSWKEYFIFNKRERRGVFVLTFLNLSALVLLAYKPVLFPADPFPRTQSQRIMADPPPLKKVEYNPTFITQKNKFSTFQRQQVKRIELNSCDSLSLVMLKGIGPSFAKRILKYRERLGGYVDVKQLMEVYGMDTLRYRLLCEQITLDVSKVRGLDINLLPRDSLRLHPYFKWNLANLVVNYRDKHGKYTTIEDLKRLDLVNDSVYVKIAPYCRVQ